MIYRVKLLFIILFLSTASILNAKQNINIGVLAKRGERNCLKKWSSTAEYLNNKISGYTFKIIPLSFEGIYNAIENNEIQFVITNTSFYAGLEKKYAASAIATLKNKVRGTIYTKFGAVIFSKKDSGINDLKDIIGKSFVAVDKSSLGGWQMAYRELKKIGIEPETDCSKLSFVKTHDLVVYNVLNGLADVGTVRTDTLERMENESKIDIKDFNIINKLSPDDSKIVYSTRLYPEWPIARLSYTNLTIAEKVTSALLSLEPNDKASKDSHTAGWTIVLNYEPVHKCLQELQLYPYENYGVISFYDILKQYKYVIIGGLIFFIIIVISLICIISLNRKIRINSIEMHEIFNAGSDAMRIITTDFKIVKVNKIFCDMIGKTADELLGKFCFENCKLEHCNRTKCKNDNCPLMSSLNNKKSDESDFVLERDGVLQYYIRTLTPLCEPNGKLISVLESFKDISSRKKSELQLNEAMKKAESANKAKSEFLSNMSHEIRTPMNAVIGFAEILKDKLDDQKLLHYADAIHNSGKALVSIINDILDLSKIEAGKLDIHYSAVSLEKIFKDVKQMFQQKMLEKSLDFIVEVTSDVPNYLILDSVRLRQILINMIGNSIKFTNTGYIKLRATTNYSSNSMDNSVILQITIEDTGIGIPENQQDSIFNSFEQVKGQSVEKFGGTGLGLAITKKLISLMNGKISVESEVGKGTIFFITLNDVEIADNDNSLLELEVVPDVEFGKATILIADDIDFNRELLMAYLEKYNYEFIEAVNGKETVELAKDKSPDLILMDIKMPVMNGEEAVKILKADLSTKDIPIVAVTASTTADQKERLKKMCDDFLVKPLSKSSLVKSLMKFIEYKDKESSLNPQNVETYVLDKLDIKAEFDKVPEYLIKDLSKLVAQNKFNSKFNEHLIEMSVYSNYLTAKIERCLATKDFSEIERIFAKIN
jgi:phosphate/phosphite/phosphonate ABC transporter binding protein